MRSKLLILAALACAVLSSPARAQYTNPHTGNTFNNAASATLDTGILNSRNSMMLFNNMMSNRMGGAAATRLATVKRLGENRIKTGKATTRFTPRPFALDYWMTQWSPATAADRSRLRDECKVQQEYWDAEARRLGTNRGDMAEVLSLDFVLAWEVYSGQKATGRQYQWLVGGFRRYLLKDVYFQGMSEGERQIMSEGQFLNASNTVREWRLAKQSGDAALQEKARQGAKIFLSAWWDEPIDRLTTTPERFTSRPK